jgi:protein SCO1
MTSLPSPLRRRLLLGGASLSLLPMLAACEKAAQGFSGIDITGADYATDFALTDHNGQARTLADFRGKVVVIFFGFTQCPDVCPTSMTEMAEDHAGERALAHFGSGMAITAASATAGWP